MILAPVLALNAARRLASLPAEVKTFSQALTTAGYTLPASRAAAFGTFVGAAKAHGYWGKLIDVHPYEGTAVAHVRVKLKGSGTLSNTGFVTGDLIAGGGVQGDGSSYFGTGLNYNTFTSGLGGLSCWIKGGYTPAGTQWLMGVGNGSTPQMVMEANNSIVGITGRWGGTGSQLCNMTLPATFPEGLYRIARSAPASLDIYLGGVYAQQNTDAVTTATRSAEITLFDAQSGGALATTAGLLFSAIDDGTMTEAENANYDTDLGTLLATLGRISRTLDVVSTLLTGQSLADGAQGLPVLTTTAVGTSITKGNGSRSANAMANPSSRAGDLPGAFRPLFEQGYETIASAFANGTGESTATSFLICNYAYGGEPYSGLKKGTRPFANSMEALATQRRMAPYRWKSHRVPFILNVHGESDYADAAYGSKVAEWQADYEADIKALTGQSGRVPMLVTQFSSWTSPSNSGLATAPNPTSLLAAHVADPAGILLVGAKYHYTYAAIDGVHLSDGAQYRLLGEYYRKAWDRYVANGQWSPLRPTAAVRVGGVITLSFAGRVGALALDTTAVSNPGNYGFEWAQTGGTARTISSVALVNGNTQVAITLSGDPGATSAERVRYAYTGTPGNNGGATTGPRGCLRDSDTAVGAFSTKALVNWCVHFDQALPL